MSFRSTVIIILALLLSACNFTLAEDITPPPNYVSPTPAPTLALYPTEAPSVETGAAIYVEKCAPCHGETGMGDGPQGIQLQGVTVPAFGLPEVARSASLSQWYTVVTRGNIERFMPPFASLSDQERWDVVAYAMTFHTTQEEIERGRELFEANCSNCSIDYFQDQSKMSSVSEVELARIIREGNEEVRAFGENLNEDEVWAVAAYLRTLSFVDSSIASASTPLVSQTEAVSVSSTAAPVEGTPIAGAIQTPVPGEMQPGFGTISGTVENQTGSELPSGLKITLRGFDHGTDPNAAPEEVLNLETSVDAQGRFTFENVEMPEGRIFLAQTAYEGITFQSEFGVTEGGTPSLTLSPIKLYGTTEDPSALVIDDARIFFDYAENAIQVYGVYSFRNISDKALVVELKDGVEIPFMKAPNGAQPLGFEPTQDSQPFTSINDNIAFPPSEESYGLIVFSTMARESQVEVSHPFVLPVTSLTVFLPAGVHAEGSQLADHGVQTIEGLNFQMYATGDLPAGNTLTFTLSGTPNDASQSASTVTSSASSNRSILIGAGVLGLALIAAGAWMFLRDRQQMEVRNNKDEETEFESPEEVMDAIIALDDLHQAKRISNQAYQKRRSELKEILKEMM